MYLTIIKNGQVIDHRDYGITCLSFTKDSVSHLNEYESVEGMHGLIPISTSFGGRPLRASFFVEAADSQEYLLSEDIIISLFATESEMYLIDSRQPEKRWKAKVTGSFGIEKVNSYIGRFNIEFLSASPYSESVETTLNQHYAKISGNKVQSYKHNTSSFEILNDGYAAINPRKHPLIIQFKGTSNNLQIKNLTTGDVWTYAGISTASDKIRLDGIRSTKNNLSIFRDTNHKLITLAPGWNEFQIVGASGVFEISFDFRFYTL